MRIVLTAHQFFPEFRAGTETLTYLTARELRSRGHTVEIWTGSPPRPGSDEQARLDGYEYEGIRVWRYLAGSLSQTGGTNAAEVEYDDPIVRERFAHYLTKFGADMVHFFHLARLSASPIRACAELRVPTAFTPTDFWFLCPTNRLRLPNGALCHGPDGDGVNCLRHIVVRTQPRWVGTVFNAIPAKVLRAAIWGAQQGWWPERQYSPLVKALFLRPSRVLDIVRSLDRILPPTRLMLEALVRFGVPQNRLRLVPYGIDLTPFTPAREKTFSPKLRLGFIGSLTWHKGAHILVRAIRLLPPDAPVEVELFGDAHEFPQYSRHLRELADGDPRVHFRGRFPGEQIAQVLSEMDALVVPSTWAENAPLVAYSAQAARTPVLASNVAGLSEVIDDGRNGLLFEMGSPSSLADIISRLEGDRALVRQLAGGAIKPRSIAEYVDDLEMLYMEIRTERQEAP